MNQLFASRAEAARAVQSMAKHVARFMHVSTRRAPGAGRPDTPESLYLVRRSDTTITELLGFRLQGHPIALLGAFELQRHRRSESRDGRSSLSQFFSTPPRTVAISGSQAAPGLIPVELPRAGESIPAFLERLRESSRSEPVYIDSGAVRFAFDLRFENPSEVPNFASRQRGSERSIFRTIGGHVFSGVTYGLHETLHKEVRYVTVTHAWQHRGEGAMPLPTLHVHREYIALVRTLAEPDAEPYAAPSLAFHPATGSSKSLLGYDLPGAEVGSRS